MKPELRGKIGQCLLSYLTNMFVELSHASLAEACEILVTVTKQMKNEELRDQINRYKMRSLDISEQFWVTCLQRTLSMGKQYPHSLTFRAQYAKHKEQVARVHFFSKEQAGQLSKELAAQEFEHAANAYSMLGNDKKRRDNLKNCGACFSQTAAAMGNANMFVEALNRYKAAIEGLSEDRNLFGAEVHADIAYCHFQLGLLNDDPEALDKAVASYNVTLSLISQTDQTALWSRAKNSLGAVLSKIGGMRQDPTKLLEAIANYKAALLVRPVETNPDKWLNTFTNILHSEFLLSKIENDPERLMRSAKVLEQQFKANIGKIDNPYQLAHTFRQFAAVYHLVGEKHKNVSSLNKALDYYNASVQIFTKATHPRFWAQLKSHIASAIFRIGLLSDDGSKTQQAITIHRELQQFFEPQGNWIWKANWYVTMGKMCDLHHQQSNDAAVLEEAIEAYRSALNLFDKQVSSIDWTSTLRSLCFSLSQRPQNILDWVEIATLLSELIDSVRRFALFATTNLQQRSFLQIIDGIGDLAAKAYCETGRPEDGLTYLLKSRAVSAELGSTMTALEKTGQSDPEFRQRVTNWKVLRSEIDRRLSEKQDALHTADLIDQAAVEKLQRLHLELSEELGQRGQNNPIYDDFTGLAQFLPQNTIVAAVYMSSHGGGVFYLQKNGDFIHRPLKELNQNAIQKIITGSGGDYPGWMKAYADFREQSGTDDQFEVETAVIRWNAFIESVLPDLWKLLMGEIDAELSSKKAAEEPELFLVLPGQLTLFPWHAAKSGSHSQHFCEKWPVTYVINPVRLFDPATQPPGSELDPTLLAITDHLDELTPLKNPALEHFPKGRQLSIPAEASIFRAELDNPSHDYTHICYFGHAVWMDDDPDHSHLLFSDGSTLSAIELNRSNFACVELAVLGACESGRTGFNFVPNEYVGLPSAFLNAGAKSVVATQWLVDANSTHIFVEKLVAENLRGKTTAQAISASQAHFISGRADNAEALKSTMDSLGAFAMLHAPRAELRQSDGPVPNSVPARTAPMFWAAFFCVI